MSGPKTPSQATPNKSGRRDSKIDCALAISERLLSVLKELARACPVPYLKEVAELTCTVLEMIDDTQSNSFGYSVVIQDIAVYTHRAIQVMMDIKEDDPLWIDLRQLVDRLQEIKVICESANKRNVVTKFLMSKRDGKKLKEVRRRFDSNVKIFDFDSTIRLRSVLENGDIKAALEHLAQLLERSPPTTQVADPGLQRYIGRTAFGGDVITTNDITGPNKYTTAPLQVYSGETLFFGKVLTENKIRLF